MGIADFERDCTDRNRGFYVDYADYADCADGRSRIMHGFFDYTDRDRGFYADCADCADERSRIKLGLMDYTELRDWPVLIRAIHQSVLNP